MSHVISGSDVEVDLENVETTDLVAELKDRGDGLPAMIAALEDIGCPTAILEALRDWERQPVADKFKWDRWIHGRGC